MSPPPDLPPWDPRDPNLPATAPGRHRQVTPRWHRPGRRCAVAGGRCRWWRVVVMESTTGLKGELLEFTDGWWAMVRWGVKDHWLPYPSIYQLLCNQWQLYWLLLSLFTMAFLIRNLYAMAYPRHDSLPRHRHAVPRVAASRRPRRCATGATSLTTWRFHDVIYPSAFPAAMELIIVMERQMNKFTLQYN